MAMPRKSPYEISLTGADRSMLEGAARSYTLPYRDVIRARIVLLAAEGLSNEEIAQRLGTRREIVGKWRKRYAEEGLAGLEERRRSGRPPLGATGERHPV